MTSWLTTIVNNFDKSLVFTTALIARSHRSGVSNEAVKLRVNDAQNIHAADWEMTGKTMRTTYYRCNLTCHLPLAKLYFAALLQNIARQRVAESGRVVQEQ